MSARRGVVRRIAFEIEYPDGRRKERVFDGSDGIEVSEIQAIVFHDSFVREDDEPNFNVSIDDWEQNPTMGVYFAPGSSDDIQSAWTCTISGPLNC